ncbi:hypothetical protein ACIOWI_35295 [Streptomyces sp. NPDC087659]|uniref:hypothetical protein n=1 Tax=Streptomyces sp. NPDC087659 TaxID=3365801 RepID=UPI0037F9AADF
MSSVEPAQIHGQPQGDQQNDDAPITTHHRSKSETTTVSIGEMGQVEFQEEPLSDGPNSPHTSLKSVGRGPDTESEKSSPASARESGVPDDHILSDTVRRFGSRSQQKVWAQGLTYIAPLSDETVAWLQDQIIDQIDEAKRNPAVEKAVRAKLNARLLSSEWARLFSERGLAVPFSVGGKTYWVALRLELSEARPGDPRIEQMSDPAGPPVAIQRWIFGISDIADTDGSGNLRPLELNWGYSWPTSFASWLRWVRLTLRTHFDYNRVNDSRTIGATVQPMVVARSRERSFPFEYRQDWSVAVADDHKAILTDESLAWRALGSPGAEQRLRVWFPTHLTDPGPGTDGWDDSDPSKHPAPFHRVVPGKGRSVVPLLATAAIPHADQLLADILRSFELDLADISDSSLADLSQFFTEGNMQGNMPLFYSGSHLSPTLFTKKGKVIGAFRVHVDLHQRQGKARIAGPTTQNSILELRLQRTLRMFTSTSVTNGVGASFGITGAFAPQASPAAPHVKPMGFAFAGQLGLQHQVVRTLNSGSSARICHLLRTADPLFNMNADAVYDITLVRPTGPERPPEAGTPLDQKHRYPLIMLMPSEATVSATPGSKRYLPPHVLHLRSLNVSTTPLAVDGADGLFLALENWLRDHDFLPPDSDRWPSWYPGPVDTELELELVKNQYKLEQIRGLGKLLALDEMIEGGHVVWFLRPSKGGSAQKVSVRITAERRYVEAAEDTGVTHGGTLKGLQNYNIAASVVPGSEQVQRSPWEVTATFQGNATDPLGDGDRTLQGITGEWGKSWHSSEVTASGVGTGDETYLLTPFGLEQFTLPVTYRMEMSWSHGPGPAPIPADGSVSLAIPAYRTLAEASDQQVPPPLPEARPPTDGNTARLENAMVPPDTALFERVEGSRAIRVAVDGMLAELARDVAKEAEREHPAMPGAYPQENSADQQGVLAQTAGATGDTDDDDGPLDMPGTFHIGQDAAPALNVPEPGAQELASAMRGVVSTAVDTALGPWRWAAALVDGAWQWTKQMAAGGDPLRAESTAQHVVETGFSPHHVAANGLRLFRDKSYVVEGVCTSGVLAGMDVTIEVKGHLTDVELLPSPGLVDYERWLQSVDAAVHTDNHGTGTSYGLGMAGNYSDPTSMFVPSGRVVHRTSTIEGDTVDDTSEAWRVMTENGVLPYRFSATAVYEITVWIGRRNVVATTLWPTSPGLAQRTVVVPEGVEFWLNDGDIHDHPEFQLIAGVPKPPEPGPLDRPLPQTYVRSGGQVGFGLPLEADEHVDERDSSQGQEHRPLLGSSRRSALRERLVSEVERIAPGVTRPGSSVYVPGLFSRISEHTASLAKRALVSAGPESWAVFHFVYRSSFGPKLVEVALNAQPAEPAELGRIRGRAAQETAGLDNMLGHLNGDGSALPKPGRTRHALTTKFANQAEFVPMGQLGGHRLRPAFALSRQSSSTQTTTSTRERRSWQRKVGGTMEAVVPYEFRFRVRSVFWDEALVVRALQTLFGNLAWTTGILLPDTWQSSISDTLVGWAAATEDGEGKVPASVKFRFNDSDSAGAVRLRQVEPLLLTEDPTASMPRATAGAVAIDMEAVPGQVRDLLRGEPWIPERPFGVYDFDAMGQFVEALREVDPELADASKPGMSTSSEAGLIRLTRLAATGTLTPLTAAAITAYVRHAGSGRISVQVLMFAPHSVDNSVDTAIDLLEIANDGASTHADSAVTPSLMLDVSPSLGDSHQNRIGAAGPLAGSSASMGQTVSQSAPRREMLKIGTHVAGASEGARGDEVTAVALLMVVGPGGTRWVVGNIDLRTTEAPPLPAPVESSHQQGRLTPPQQDTPDENGGGSPAADPIEPGQDSSPQDAPLAPAPGNETGAPRETQPAVSSDPPAHAGTAPGDMQSTLGDVVAALLGGRPSRAVRPEGDGGKAGSGTAPVRDQDTPPGQAHPDQKPAPQPETPAEPLTEADRVVAVLTGLTPPTRGEVT